MRKRRSRKKDKELLKSRNSTNEEMRKTGSGGEGGVNPNSQHMGSRNTA
jgi:hypothetical protein